MEALTLLEIMKCSILSNQHGDILLSHNKPLKADVEWIEFNPVKNSFLIVYEDGSSQNLGIEIPHNMITHITKGKEVKIAHVENSILKSTQNSTIIIQDY